MNKKIILLVCSILVVVLVLSGGTFAYFTTQTQPKTNEFKPGILFTTIIENGNETGDSEA